MPYHVYILECADGTFYTGVTNDLDRRLKEHRSGCDPKSYTAQRRPVELKWYTSFTRVELAIDKEKQIKKWSASKKRALIKEDWDRVRELAKKTYG